MDDDQAFNVNLKKNIIHKSSYLVKKATVEAWLRFLVEQPLYKHYGIVVDWSVFRNSSHENGVPNGPQENIEPLNVSGAPESELLHAVQQTLMLNERQSSHIAPGQHNSPASLLFDKYAGELSFPSIYYGVAREIRSSDGSSVRATPYSMATSEIRREDRRGATSQHILFMVMKNCRFRVRDGIQNMCRCLRTTETITREQMKDRDFLQRLIETNQAFLKTIPNSCQYWSSRKNEVLAMIRQLGRPSAFLTLSSNETRWLK